MVKIHKMVVDTAMFPNTQSNVCTFLFQVVFCLFGVVENYTNCELQDLYHLNIFLNLFIAVVYYIYQHMPCIVANVGCSTPCCPLHKNHIFVAIVN